MYSPDQELAFRKENKEEEKKFPSHPFLNEESLVNKVLLSIDLDDTLIIDEHGNYILNKEIAEAIAWLGHPFAIVTMRDPQESSAMFTMIRQPQRERKTIDFCLRELKKHHLSPEKIITCYDPLEENFYQNFLHRIEVMAITLANESESKDEYQSRPAENQMNYFLSKQNALCEKIENEYFAKNQRSYKSDANQFKQMQLQYLAKIYPNFIIVHLDDSLETFTGLMELKNNPPKNMDFLKNLFPVHFNRKDSSYLWLSEFINYADPQKKCDIEKLPESLKKALEICAVTLATRCHKKIVQLVQEAKEKVTQDDNNVSQLPTTEKIIDDYLQKGNRFFMKEDYAESLQCYESALKLQLEHVEVLVCKGKVLQKLNRLEEAKQAYQQAIAIEDKSADKYHQQAKKQLGKIENKQAQILSQQQVRPTIVSTLIESTEREELLGRVSSKTELRKPNVELNSAMKQTKTTDPSVAIPLSRNLARVQFSHLTTSQTNVPRQNKNSSKEESSGIADEKASVVKGSL